MIRAYVGSTMGPDKIARTAVIVHADKEAMRKAMRLKSGSTLNLAELEGAIFALECIHPKFRVEPVELHTRAFYLLDLTKKDSEGNWLAKPQANKETVLRFRDVLSTFKDVKIIRHESGSANNESANLIKSAKEAAAKC